MIPIVNLPFGQFVRFGTFEYEYLPYVCLLDIVQNKVSVMPKYDYDALSANSQNSLQPSECIDKISRLYNDVINSK